MKLHIVSEPKPPEPRKWKGGVRLEQTERGVRLIAVYDDGEMVIAGTLLLVSGERGVQLASSVNRDLGLPLDEHGCLKVNP